MNHPKTGTERRTKGDRRKFAYTAYSPERRSGVDRRARAAKKSINGCTRVLIDAV